MVNNNFPVTPEMYRSREAELALLKGMEVKLHPLIAEACEALELQCLEGEEPELAGRKGVINDG